MAKVTDMRSNKKVEDTVDEKNTEVVVQDEFDYEKLSQRIFDRLCEFHKNMTTMRFTIFQLSLNRTTIM